MTMTMAGPMSRTGPKPHKAARIIATTWLGIAAFFWLNLPLAYSCASCGSGGDDPLILYPNESDKILVAAARTAGLRNIDKNGSETTAGGPTERHAFTLAYGHSFSMRSFATLTLPMLRNAREGTAKTAVGDPSFATRYTLHMASLLEPWVPQVQILAGFKPGLARSIQETQDPKSLLDVFGTGFSEVRTGLDLWLAQFDQKVGMAQTFSFPLPSKFDGTTYTPGIISRSTLTLGYQWLHDAKTLVGINREQRGELRAAGTAIPNSDQLNYSLFTTQDWLPDENSMFRLTLSQQAAFGKNKNTARSSTITFAFQRSLRS